MSKENPQVGQYVPASDHPGMNNGNLRVISEPYFGYLVGQVREVLEASIPNEKQLKAIESIVLDRLYGWFAKIGDQLTEEEYGDASVKHWKGLEGESTQNGRHPYEVK
jgi:hypothetical protein